MRPMLCSSYLQRPAQETMLVEVGLLDEFCKAEASRQKGKGKMGWMYSTCRRLTMVEVRDDAVT